MPSALIYTDAYVNYQYSDAHPLKPYRLRLTHALMQHYGLLQLPGSGVREKPMTPFASRIGGRCSPVAAK